MLPAVGGADTDTDALPLMPSAVARTTVEPTRTAVTTPLLTVAVSASSVLHVNVAPAIALPDASRAVAVSVPLLPATSASAPGDSVTDATAGGCTVIVLVPVRPSLVAVIVAVPVATGVTTPALETVAMAVLDVDHVTARPVSVLPAASRVVAVRETVPLPTRMVAVAGVTATVATGTCVTVTAAEAVRPSQVATACVVPAAIAVTRPTALTVATPVALLPQPIVRPVRAAPV